MRIVVLVGRSSHTYERSNHDQRDPDPHLDAPGVTCTYDVHGDPGAATSERTVLMMVGSPMEAAGFGTLASHFTDRPVVTYDPRGVGRSKRTDDQTESTPAQHADDIARVVDALGVGPVDLFASSGGAVNSLALVAARPDLVRTLVAHEPPLAAYVPDREQVLAANRDIGETYQRAGSGPAMAKFLQLVMVEGPVPYVPDVAALGSAPTRIVVAAGVESAQQLTGRAAAGFADALGVELTVFPSHHGGFLGGEFGQQGEPEAFAARLREVL